MATEFTGASNEPPDGNNEQFDNVAMRKKNKRKKWPSTLENTPVKKA